MENIKQANKKYLWPANQMCTQEETKEELFAADLGGMQKVQVLWKICGTNSETTFHIFSNVTIG